MNETVSTNLWYSLGDHDVRSFTWLFHCTLQYFKPGSHQQKEEETTITVRAAIVPQLKSTRMPRVV